MEIKDLQREILEAERLIARDTLILQLNAQSEAQGKELDAAKRDIADRDTTIATLTADIATA